MAPPIIPILGIRRNEVERNSPAFIKERSRKGVKLFLKSFGEFP